MQISIGPNKGSNKILTDNSSFKHLLITVPLCGKDLGVTSPHSWGWLSLQSPAWCISQGGPRFPLSGKAHWRVRAKLHFSHSNKPITYNIYLSFVISETEVAVLTFVHKQQLQVWFLSALPFWKILEIFFFFSFSFFPFRWRCHLVPTKIAKNTLLELHLGDKLNLTISRGLLAGSLPPRALRIT